MMRLVIAAAAIAIATISLVSLSLPNSVISCLLGWSMLAITVSDARRLIVPDILSLPAIPAGLLATMLTTYGSGPVLDHLAASALGGAVFYAIRLVYFRLRARHGLGLGDVKLAAVTGAWTGLDGLSLVLLFATAAAMGWILVAHVIAGRRLDGASAIPFGAFLAPAIWLTWWLAAAGFDRLATLIGS